VVGQLLRSGRDGVEADEADEDAVRAAEALLPGPWTIYSDAQAAVWAEHVDGVAKGSPDVLLVHLGWRPTLGMIFDGEPRTGARGAAGDLRWDALRPIGDRVPWPPRLLDKRGDYVRDIVQAALAGEPDAVAGAMEYMLAAIPPVVLAANVLDPDLLVLGGAFAPLAHLAIDRVVDELAEQMPHPPAVAVSHLDEFAVALGAAQLARKDVLDNLISPTEGVRELTAAALPYDAPADLMTHNKRPIPRFD
jgi:predicted NBD/HSP70 family sugar kinase